MQPAEDRLPDLATPECTRTTRQVHPSAPGDRPPTDVAAAFAVALHMHQPLIPAGGPDLATAAVVSNLRHMIENPAIPDAHNAAAFLDCYGRMGEIVPRLVAEGLEPRVMLDYSGCLLHGLIQMGRGDVIDRLRPLATDPRYIPCVEWLGTAWGHAVAPSTPPQDFRLHVRAWRLHYGSIFGPEALARVRGFSPPEMALPNHPDVCYEFVRTLRECGYDWVLVQEHTVEADDGGPVRDPHLPHRLAARNSNGEEASIVALVKTRGSDTKLVGQMQPYYEAKGLARATLDGRSIPRLVSQIADGENGGVMMNEFVPKFEQVMREAARPGAHVPPTTGSEYLAHVTAAGVSQADFPVLRPLFHHRIRDRLNGRGPDALADALASIKEADPTFHVEGGSWTNDRSWVAGYAGVLGPMRAASAAFAQHIAGQGVPASDPRHRAALFHLLCAQTSCFRYWGEGTWADYGRELCRRAILAANGAD
ncbi:MAG TPA: hypothetical protein VEA69_09575 [Tepidisphaeraceae bacterium]|nr:hypothetical protein [Tepidisphaeraceae bacterium]